MTFGEQNPTVVLELLRWLGPGAELIEPHTWRERMRVELSQMLAYYTLNDLQNVIQYIPHSSGGPAARIEEKEKAGTPRAPAEDFVPCTPDL